MLLAFLMCLIGAGDEAKLNDHWCVKNWIIIDQGQLRSNIVETVIVFSSEGNINPTTSKGICIRLYR